MSPSATSPQDVSSTAKRAEYGDFNVEKMTYTLVPEAEQQPVPGLQHPGRMTQKLTTAHMVLCKWDQEEGWAAPEMMPYGKISLEPTASVLHYATESFEGMKVYRGYDNKIRLFRPRLNCERLIKSNARVCLPSFNPERLLEILTAYLAIECRRWLPEPGSNLYVRPAMIGSGSALGIQKPPEALFFLFAALFPQSSRSSPGIKLVASDSEYIRAWPGGFGSAKVGASYGPAMVAHAKSKEQGCSQTLWLFGEEKLVTEAGASNFFVVWRLDDGTIELVTSSLDTGVILEGITRRSVLEIARERLIEGTASAGLTPLKVTERPFSMDEILKAHHEGRLIESFVSGTAMFISPVSMIRYGNEDIHFPMTVTDDNQKTPLSKYSSAIKSWLEDIIYGRTEHEWGYVLPGQ